MRLVSTDAVSDRWLLQVRGAADIIVEDQQGRRIGPLIGQEYRNVYENQIPGASYKPGEAYSSVFLNRPGVYTFTLSTKIPNRVHIYLSVFNAGGKLGTFFFQSVPLIQASQGRIIYNPADSTVAPTLDLDYEGNGAIQQIEPVLLTPEASSDMAPPVTQIYASDNVVTVVAADNPGGAGVLRTYYSTDGVTRAVYTGPFAVPLDARIVMAYSEDRAGNTEYPGAVRPVLATSESFLVLTAPAGSPAPVERTIDVLNPDPFSMTGQLEWEASTDSSWLALAPARGTTPSQLLIRLDAVALTAGTYNAGVIVQSLTAATILGQRVVRVRADITDT
jgi:hypothetical protein